MSIPDPCSLKDRVALVTAGAGPLLGRSPSEARAEAGATVISASRSLNANRQFAEDLRGMGYEAHGMRLDISDPESIAALHQQVMRQFGRLDVLVNSALTRDGHGGGFEEQTEETWAVSASGDM